MDKAKPCGVLERMDALHDVPDLCAKCAYANEEPLYCYGNRYMAVSRDSAAEDAGHGTPTRDADEEPGLRASISHVE